MKVTTKIVGAMAGTEGQPLINETLGDALAEIQRLRQCLTDTRHEICIGPVDDTLWHEVIQACTTVDNICMALDDGWSYDKWLEINAQPKKPGD